MSTSESSPSPDQNVDKARKNRKPDMQLYVPRGKRLENQAKQNSINTFPPAVDSGRILGRECLKSNEEGNCISPPPSTSQAKIIYPSSNSDQPDGVCTLWPTSPFNGREHPIEKPSSLRICRPENSFSSAAQQSNNKKQCSDSTVARPDAKLPQHHIYEMLKKYNISTTDNNEQQFQKNSVNFSTGVFSPSANKSRDDSKFDFISHESDLGNDILGSSAMASAVVSSGEDFLTSEENALPFSSTNSNLFNKSNDADFILSSLPKSYDEFESKDLHKTFFNQQQRSYSPSCTSDGSFLTRGRTNSFGVTSSSSPSNIDPDDLEVQLINESFEEQLKQAQVLSNAKVKEAFYRQPNHVPTTTNSSSSNAAAETTIVKQQQVPSTTQAPGHVRDKGNSIQAPQHRPLRVIERKGSSESHSSPVSAVVGDQRKPKPGLTWAGWGSSVTSSGSFSGVSDRLEKPGRPLNGSSTTSHCVMESQHKKSSSGSLITSSSSSTCSLTFLNDSKIGIPSSSLAPFDPYSPTKPPSSSVISSNNSRRGSISVKNPAAVSPATQNLDVLSKAMVEQVLLGDEDDVEAASAAQFGGNNGKKEHIFRFRSDSLSSLRPAGAGSAALNSPKFSASASSACVVSEGTAAAAAAAAGVNAFVPSALTVMNDGYVNDALPGRKASNSSVVDLWEDIDANFIPNFTRAVSETSFKSPPPIDYLKFDFKDVEISDDFGHVLEAYDFSPSLRTENLYAALQQINCRYFNIEWVDESHALIVLSDQNAAQSALQGTNPILKLRPLRQASAQSKRKAKVSYDLLRPYKPRPETNVFLARRLVENHLGKKSVASQATRNQERMKIAKARENKRITAQLKEDAWEGKL